MASGRQVGSLLLSSHPVARCFPIVPIEARAHTVHPLPTSRCVPAFIIITVIIISWLMNRREVQLERKGKERKGLERKTAGEKKI